MQPRTLTIGLIFLILTLTTSAQEAPESGVALTTPVQEAPESAKQILNIDFPGGVLTDLLDTVEEQNDLTLNVIVSLELREQEIPSLKLRNVHLEELMPALENLGKFRVVSGGPNIFTVIPLPKPRRPSPPPSQRSTRDRPAVTIHDIRSLIVKNNTRHFLVDDIVTAVHVGWDMMPDKGAPSLKFHEETNLLIVQGTSDELRIAQAVLGILNESQGRRELQKQVDILKKQVKDLQEINKMLEGRLDKTHKEINK